MSSIAEIERYRERVLAAQAQQRTEDSARYLVSDTLPPNFYNPEQLERYKRVDSLLVNTTTDFMNELGIDYRLRRQFRTIPPILFGPFKRDMTYILKLKDLEAEPNKEHIWINYQVGGGLVYFNEGLFVDRGAALLAPPKKQHIGLEVQEAMQYMNDPRPTTVNYCSLHMFSITEGNIRDMLSLIVANPKYNVPLTV